MATEQFDQERLENAARKNVGAPKPINYELVCHIACGVAQRGYDDAKRAAILVLDIHDAVCAEAAKRQTENEKAWREAYAVELDKLKRAVADAGVTDPSKRD